MYVKQDFGYYNSENSINQIQQVNFPNNTIYRLACLVQLNLDFKMKSIIEKIL